jgi:Chemoreceptor zinc-binding domain
MAIVSWFKRQASSAEEGADEPPARRGAEAGGLNFMAAIDVHMKWCSRLESFIQGTSKEKLKLDAVSRDDRCELGRWIYGTGAERYGTLDTFAEMKAQHAHFHVCAGKVLATALADRRQEALHMLSHGDYLRASERVKMLLAKLYVQIAERA